MKTSRIWINLLAIVAFGVAMLYAVQIVSAPEAQRSSYIVQGHNLDDVKAAVLDADGIIEKELGIINGVSALLCKKGVALLEKDERVTQLTANGGVEVAGPVLDTQYGALINADELHGQGIDGSSPHLG